MNDRDETIDLLIVGAGPAGMAAAYGLRHTQLSVLVLESRDEVGGRTKSVRMPGGMANTGAQFIYRNTPSEALARELGLDAIPYEPRTYGISIGSQTSVSADLATVVDGLSLDATDKEALSEFLAGALAEYQASTHGGTFTAESQKLADQTVAERLHELPASVREILDTAVRGGAVGDSHEISALYALRYFASYLALEQENRLVLTEGMQAIVSRMADSLPDDVLRLSTTVTEVVFDAEHDEFVVSALVERSKRTRHRARSVLLAVPGPVVSGLVPDLPAWKSAALAKARTPGSTTMIIAADVRGVEEYRDWSFVTTVGRKFECIINPTPGRWRSEAEPGLVHFVCYGNTPGYQPDVPGDPEREREWLEDFFTVAPGLRGRIVAHHISTWEHCFALLNLERAAAGPDLQASVGRLHFAGDWTSPSAGTHGALEEGQRVAKILASASALR